MKVDELFDCALGIVESNREKLYTAWRINRKFEKWLQFEILTSLAGRYQESIDDFQEFFHSEYRASLDQRGHHEKKFKQVDLYVSNGKNDSNDYMYIELKTGFQKEVVSQVRKDYFWLGKIKQCELAKEKVALLVLINSKEKTIGEIINGISKGVEKKPSEQKIFSLQKGEKSPYVAVAIWKHPK